MTLCNDRIIELLNTCFVPLSVNLGKAGLALAPQAPITAKSVAGRRLLSEVNAKSSAHPSVVLVQSYLASTDGSVSDFDTNMMPQDPTRLFSTIIERVVRERAIVPGPALGRYRSHSASAQSASDLQLRVVLRYRDPHWPARQDQFHAALMGGNFGETKERNVMVYAPAPTAPTRDWITLSRAECQRLLPPLSFSPGQAYDLDARLAVKILYALRPEPSMSVGETEPPSEAVRQASMTGRLLWADDTSAVVSIDGQFDIIHPGLDPQRKDPRWATNWIAGRVQGYLEFNPATREIQEFEMRTIDASYNSHAGGQLLFDGITYLVPSPLHQN